MLSGSGALGYRARARGKDREYQAAGYSGRGAEVFFLLPPGKDLSIQPTWSILTPFTIL